MSEDIENARVKYQIAVNLFTSEGQAQWGRYNSVLLLNSILIGLIGFAYGNVNLRTPFQLTVSVLGLIICKFWYQINKRGFIWMNHWITEAGKLEGQLTGRINPIRQGAKLRSKIGFDVTKNATLTIINLVALIYFFMLIVGVYQWALNYIKI